MASRNRGETGAPVYKSSRGRQITWAAGFCTLPELIEVAPSLHWPSRNPAKRPRARAGGCGALHASVGRSARQRRRRTSSIRSGSAGPFTIPEPPWTSSPSCSTIVRAGLRKLLTPPPPWSWVRETAKPKNSPISALLETVMEISCAELSLYYMIYVGRAFALGRSRCLARRFTGVVRVEAAWR